MRTVRCCGHLSCHEMSPCHACPLLSMPPPTTHALTAMHVPLLSMPPPCMPPAKHVPPARHTPCHTCPSATHAPHQAHSPAMHIPLPCTPLPVARILDTHLWKHYFPQLRLWTVITVYHSIAVTDNAILWNYEQSIILSNNIKQIAFELMYNRCHWEWVRLLRSPGYNEQIFYFKKETFCLASIFKMFCKTSTASMLDYELNYSHKHHPV